MSLRGSHKGLIGSLQESLNLDPETTGGQVGVSGVWAPLSPELATWVTAWAGRGAQIHCSVHTERCWPGHGRDQASGCHTGLTHIS